MIVVGVVVTDLMIDYQAELNSSGIYYYKAAIGTQGFPSLLVPLTILYILGNLVMKIVKDRSIFNFLTFASALATMYIFVKELKPRQQAIADDAYASHDEVKQALRDMKEYHLLLLYSMLVAAFFQFLANLKSSSLSFSTVTTASVSIFLGSLFVHLMQASHHTSQPDFLTSFLAATTKAPDFVSKPLMLAIPLSVASILLEMLISSWNPTRSLALLLLVAIAAVRFFFLDQLPAQAAAGELSEEDIAGFPFLNKLYYGLAGLTTLVLFLEVRNNRRPREELKKEA